MSRLLKIVLCFTCTLLLVSCKIKSPISLDRMTQYTLNDKRLILIPSGALENSVEVNWKGLNYTLACNKEKIVKFVFTDDIIFNVSGVRVGSSLGDQFLEKKLFLVPGWAYCISISEG